MNKISKKLTEFFAEALSPDRIMKKNKLKGSFRGGPQSGETNRSWAKRID